MIYAVSNASLVDVLCVDILTRAEKMYHPSLVNLVSILFEMVSVR